MWYLNSQLHALSYTGNLFAGGIARAILRQNGVPNEPWVFLPNPNFTKRSRVKVPWPDEENKEDVSPIVLDETRFFPNPTQGDLFAEVHLKAQGGVLTFIDMHGKIIYQKTMPQGKHKVTVPTQQWAKGIYFGRIIVDGKVVFEEKIALK